MDMDKEKSKLIIGHEKTMNAMLRRIERDRREQVKHRQFDTQKMIKRNKNLITSIYDRQLQEKRKTRQFLQWALSDIHDITETKPGGVRSVPVTRSVKISKSNKNKKLIKPLDNIKIASRVKVPMTHEIKKNNKLFKRLKNKRESEPIYKRPQQMLKNDSNLMILRNQK